MNDNGLIRSAFLFVLFLFAFLIVIISLLSVPLRTRATANTLTLKIKMQGIRKTGDEIKARVDFYNGPDKTSTQESVSFMYKDGAFIGDIALASEFSFTDRYALFIKPEKSVGRIFCSSQLTGTQCSSPGFFFLPSGSTADLTAHVFYVGDIAPANGKVDAGDMSNIMKSLGKMSTATDSATDLNGDGITDVTDYSLAFYSLSQSAKDDTVQLSNAQPSATPAPSAAATATPAPTAAPSVTPAPTAIPTAVPTATTAPTPTTAPTSPPPPSPTTAAAATCHFTIPDGYGDPFDLKSGETSECGCEDYMFMTICSTISCKSCPSGTCNCAISMQLPPYNGTCSNGGSFSVNKVSSCN